MPYERRYSNPAYVTKEVKNKWIYTSRPLPVFMPWTGTSRPAFLPSISNIVHITGPILAKLAKTGPHWTFVSRLSLVQSDQFQWSPMHNEIYLYVQHAQLHDQLYHCQLLSKRVRWTVMLLTFIRKVCSSNFEFTQSFLLCFYIMPGSHSATCHRTFYDFGLFPASLNNSCSQYSLFFQLTHCSLQGLLCDLG